MTPIGRPGESGFRQGLFPRGRHHLREQNSPGYWAKNAAPPHKIKQFRDCPAPKG